MEEGKRAEEGGGGVWLKAKRGLGGEWELGRLVVPAEVATRWQHGSSLSPPSPCLPPCVPPCGHPQQSALTLLPGGVGTREFTAWNL